jgi:hypothetical protein
MFDRFIRLARARKALREQRAEDALQLALDPLIAGDRRAEEVREAAGELLLARARQRLAQGDAAAAKGDAERVRRVRGDAAVADVLRAIDAAVAGGEASRQATRQAFLDARAAIDAGELGKAEAVLATRGDALAATERRQLEAWLTERRRQAAAACVHGEHALDAGAVDDAIAQLARAELLDRDHEAVVRLRAAIARRGATACASTVVALLDAGDVAGACARRDAFLRALPSLRAVEPMLAADRRLGAVVSERLCAAADAAAAIELARAADAAALPLAAPAAPLAHALLAAVQGDGRTGGDGAAAWAAVAASAAAAGAAALATAARARQQALAAGGERLAAARAFVDRGDLDGARAELTALLAAEPLHDGARRELDLLDQTCADLDRRVVEARAALRAGRLREACAIALALGGSARVAADAQQVLTQARASMALVDRGLDEVRAALHGRATSGIEGVRHCHKRLEELAKVQSDHPELPRVTAAVAAEIEALELCERIAAALGAAVLGDVLRGFGELLALRARLLAPERLEARFCDLADRLARQTDVALASGRLQDVARCAELFEELRAVRAEFAALAAGWRESAAARRATAERLCGEARERLQERDLAEAERLVEQARLQWLECDGAKVLGAELRTLREQTALLARAESMARERDFHGARQKLAAMPSPSPLLRTRIYDMKQDLARAQGLEGAFLLRVDEGGEQLVLRGESVTIGNVRQMRADLPVLANLAGRHASIRRSMSFHGGMQDTIVAEEGDVRVGGEPVKNRSLAPGDRVQLGPALGLVYQRPTGRSLTVGLVLQSGFQVAGTDRILLMKDRGRDGRILLGPGADVHVRVARATGEVEIFATAAGQMRIACASGGTIDGVPFQGEHPLAAGQRIEAAGMAFQLLPWRPAA